MQAQCPALAAQMTWQPLPLGRACQRGQPAQVARCALTHQPPLTISVLVKSAATLLPVGQLCQRPASLGDKVRRYRRG